MLRWFGTVARFRPCDRSAKHLNCNYSKSCMCARVTHKSHTYARHRFHCRTPSWCSLKEMQNSLPANLFKLWQSCALIETTCRADTRRLIWSDNPWESEKLSPAAEAQATWIWAVNEMSPRCFLFLENISETNLIKFCIHAEQVGPPPLPPSPFPYLPTVSYLRNIFCLFSQKIWDGMEKKKFACLAQTNNTKRRTQHHHCVVIQYLFKINALLCSLGQSNLRTLYVITLTPMQLTQTACLYVHGDEIHLSVSWC